MKPVNLDNSPCTPQSSNCVIWQGPDIPCIKLCAGDVITDVVYNLAVELCTILDQLNVKNYDLSCFGITNCGPNDFNALIQFLIDQICALQGVTPTTEKSGGGCPDCIVTTAECFILKGYPSSMQLLEYVNAIATEICSIINRLTEIENTIIALQDKVEFIYNNYCPSCPPLDPIEFTLQCDIGTLDMNNSYPIDTILANFINGVWCDFSGATGDTGSIISAVASQCISPYDYTKSDPEIQYKDLTGWKIPGTGDPLTLADSIYNIWLVLCDLYNGAKTTVVEGGEGITVTSSTLGTETTYTVTNDYLETFTANLDIRSTYAPVSGNIPKKNPNLVQGVQEGQSIYQYTNISCNGSYVSAPTGGGNYVNNSCIPSCTFGSFDNSTGVFTITESGTYLINASIHLKPDASITEFWSGETTYSDPPTVTQLADNFKALGSFILGITPNNNTDIYVGQGQTLIPSIDRNVEISVSKVIPVNTTSNPQTLKVKVLNTTNRDYNGTGYTGSDFITFSITKLRNVTSFTTCNS